jgi:hypothetical protein
VRTSVKVLGLFTVAGLICFGAYQRLHPYARYLIESTGGRYIQYAVNNPEACTTGPGVIDRSALNLAARTSKGNIPRLAAKGMLAVHGHIDTGCERIQVTKDVEEAASDLLAGIDDFNKGGRNICKRGMGLQHLEERWEGIRAFQRCVDLFRENDPKKSADCQAGIDLHAKVKKDCLDAKRTPMRYWPRELGRLLKGHKSGPQ